MRLADPVATPWRAELRLGFARVGGKSLLRERACDGPLVVQKPLYPEGESVCHAIVVHPPGGIAGGDQLHLKAAAERHAHALLTTPGAARWYRSAGPWASQALAFEVDGTLEWLPRESIFFDATLARLETRIALGSEGRFVGWEVACLGRFKRGRVRMETRVQRGAKLLFAEKGEIDQRLLGSPAGLGGRSVFGTFIATSTQRVAAPDCLAVTRLPELLVARYLGDSSEEALQAFAALWKALRPTAVEPRIWRT